MPSDTGRIDHDPKPVVTDGWSYSTDGRVAEFDSLFVRDDRIWWPGQAPLTVLIRGTEGAGKSTLAIQLACLGRARQPVPTADARPRCVLYYVADDLVERIIEKLYAFNICPNPRLDRLKAGGNGEKPPDTWLCGDGPLRGPSLCSDALRRAVAIGHPQFHTFLSVLKYDGPRNREALMATIREDLRAAESAKEFGEYVVVIDSVTAVDWSASPPEGGVRTEGAGRMERILSGFPFGLPHVFILVDENLPNDGRDPYLTDVYVELWQGDRRDFARTHYCERYLQIVKAANCPHVRGPQLFRIVPDLGIMVIPSVIASAHTLEGQWKGSRGAAPPKRVRLGLENLGESGRIDEGSSSLVIGPPGSLKTRIAVRFCAEAIANQGRAVFLSLRDEMRTIEGLIQEEPILRQLSQDHERSMERTDTESLRHVTGSLRFLCQAFPLSFMPPEFFLAAIRRILRRIRTPASSDGPAQPVRLVIDAVSDLQANYPRLSRAPGFLSSLVHTLAAQQVTSLLVFNESEHAAVEDKIILDLVDNVFLAQRQSIKGRSHVLLQAQELGKRRLGNSEHIYQIDRDGLQVTDAEGEFCRGEDDRLHPVTVRVFAARCQDRLEQFHHHVCKAQGIPEGNLDQELALGSLAAVNDLVDRLLAQHDTCNIMAIDIAYLSDELKQKFVPLELGLEVGEDREDRFLAMAGATVPLEPFRLKGDGDKVRLFPVYLDCSLTLCNLSLLDRILECEAGGSRLNKIRERLVRSIWSRESKSSLPVVERADLLQAADEFDRTRGGDRVFLFGFDTRANPEPPVCTLLNWLNAYGIRFPEWREKDRPPAGLWNEETWSGALLDFARFYLARTADNPTGAASGAPGSGPGTNGKGSSAPIRTVDNCVFFHTWQSLAIGPGTASQYIPVRLGTDWKDVVGGWCWGLVDNGAGTRRGADIIRYACGSAMNAFLIDNVIGGIPPRRDMCHPIGIPSVRDLGLMSGIVEHQTWDRSKVWGYSRLSSVLSVIIHEFLSALDGLIPNRSTDTGEPDWLRRWLHMALPSVFQGIRQSLGISLSSSRNGRQRKR